MTTSALPNGHAPDDEVTINVTVRVKAGHTDELTLQHALLGFVHGFPGYVAAGTRVVRRDPANSPHPYPLDTPQRRQS